MAAVLCVGLVVAVFLLRQDDHERRDRGAGEPARLHPSARLEQSRETPLDSARPVAGLTAPVGADAGFREFGGDRRFACDPYPDEQLTGDDMAARLEREQQEAERRVRALEESEDSALRLAAALLTDKRSPDHLQRFLSALALDPDNPVILERLLDACINRPDSRVCEERDIVERAVAADGENGEMWGAIAGYRASRGDDDGALEALRRGASAGTHREFFADQVRIIERGLAASAGDLSYVERMGEGAGRAAGLMSSWLDILSDCRDRVAGEPLWRAACLDFARQLGERSQTVLNRGIGIDMEATIAEETGDEMALAAARKRQLAFRKWRDEHLTTEGQVVLMGDERVMRQYIDEFDAYGEPAALEYVADEVRRLKRVPGYDPCPRRRSSPAR